MDKYELKVSIDEVDRLIDERRFREAAEVADTIDWTRVKSVHTICRVSDLYKINKRYADSRDLLMIAYEKNPTNRKIIYSLCELELKLNNYIHALQLYNAFINVAPRDSDRYLLQYKLYKKQDVNVREQIAVLEEFLQHDFRERWAYELATLYLRAEEPERCIGQCDEIVTYFGDGRFVIRALELKKSLTQLTPQQEERLEILKSGGTIAPPAPAPEAEEAENGQDPVPSDDQEKEKSADSAEAEGAASAEAEDTVPAREETAQVSGDTRPMPALSRVRRDAAAGNPAAVEPAAEEPAYAEPDAYESGSGETDEEDGGEPAATPKEYTDALLRDVNMEETIARGMREIDDYDSVLAQETSGQFTMVMEEDPPEETQVEGQLDLEQIMSEWEKIRKESEQQRLAQARRRVLERSEEAKRQLYGEDAAAGTGPAGDPQDGGTAAGGRASGSTGSTRSWKREDVEKGLRKQAPK